MMNAPFNYNQINAMINSYEPNTLKKCDNARFHFWQRAFLQRVQSLIEIDGLPEQWKGRNKNFLYFALFTLGFVAVSDKSDKKKYGTYFSPAFPSGVSMYFQPTKVILNNPVMAGKELEIGKDCELLQFTPDYCGIMDIINYFAEQMALADTAMNTSLVNSKIPFILGGKTKATVQAIKKMLDNVNEGETATFYDTRIRDDEQTQDTPFQQVKLFTASDYISDKLQETHNTILNQFDNEIGIPSVPYEKKERLISSEVDTKAVDSTARCRVWLDCLKNSCEVINAHYGLNLSAKLTYLDLTANGKGGDENANTIQP